MRAVKQLIALAILTVAAGLALCACAQAGDATPVRPVPQEPNDAKTASPIRHVVVIIGENRTFDHVFATYLPKPGETVWNLLSQGIVDSDGSPGPNYAMARQYSARAKAPGHYRTAPQGRAPYSVLPTPLAGGPTEPFIAGVAFAKEIENGLAADYYVFLTTGGTGLRARDPDTRISYDGRSVTNLPPGPFQLTPGVPYDAYAQSPVHRFYQMWQQLDCDVGYATAANPSGCRADLFPWVEVMVGAGGNGKKRPANFTDATTGEGATAMGFYNMQQGDAPYLKALADGYAMSDNFHQAMNGGTGANHVMLATGDAIWFSDGNGNPMPPPNHETVGKGTANRGVVAEIEDPDPAPGTNNWYREDGYGGGSVGKPSFGGGSYSNCADIKQPGVAAIVHYLASLPRPIDPRCAPGHFYLLNNYNPGYFGDGTNAYADMNDANTVFTIPPSNLRNIGDALLEHQISWAYFGDQWNRYLADRYVREKADTYCNICNFAQYSTTIMVDRKVRETHLLDTADLYAAIKKGELPAVSFVKPSGLVDGHPATSKLDLFEGFVKKIVDLVRAQPDLWQETAIFVMFDEGGGYWDSGYVQPLDFFGDGTRIPFLVVSPHTAAGHISHSYADHVSILKFIERNWNLSPLTARSRDNFPNPVPSKSNPYVPNNSPAIGDLFDLFDFGG